MSNTYYIGLDVHKEIMAQFIPPDGTIKEIRYAGQRLEVSL